MSNPSVFKQYLSVVALAGLLFLLNGVIVSSALAASQTVTDKPISGKTTTVPAGKVLPEKTTTTVPLPSTAPAREYQQVDKPPIKRLDIPEYDLAVEFKILEISGGDRYKNIRFVVMLKNHGKKTITSDKLIPVKTMVINTETNVLIDERTQYLQSDKKDLRSEHWVYMLPVQLLTVYYELKNIKLIVDVDPDNTYKEPRSHRGNNRYVVSW